MRVLVLMLVMMRLMVRVCLMVVGLVVWAVMWALMVVQWMRPVGGWEVCAGVGVDSAPFHSLTVT